MRTSTVLLAVLALMIASAATVTAQGTCPAPSGEDQWMKMWNVRLGAFVPRTQGDFKTSWNVGIEHEHPANEIIKGLSGNFSLSADYTRFRSFNGVETRNVTLVPVYLNWKRHYMIPALEGQSWYWGFGAGLYLASADIPEMGITNQSQFAWNAGAGYYFNPSWFGEVRYLASKEPADSRIFSLDVGYSF